MTAVKYNDAFQIKYFQSTHDEHQYLCLFAMYRYFASRHLVFRWSVVTNETLSAHTCSSRSTR